MSIQSFEFNAQTDEIIERLMRVFQVRTPAEVIQRSLALASEASKFAGEDRIIVLSGPDGATKLDLRA